MKILFFSRRYLPASVALIIFLAQPFYAAKALPVGNRPAGDPRPKVTCLNKVFDGFSDAFIAVFNDAVNDFKNYQGDLRFKNSQSIDYTTTIHITDPQVVPSNIFYKYKGATWAFRFVITGSTANESAQFESVMQDIQQAFVNANIRFVKSKLAYPNAVVDLGSIQYKSADRLVECYRTASGDSFDDEIIVYHLPQGQRSTL